MRSILLLVSVVLFSCQSPSDNKTSDNNAVVTIASGEIKLLNSMEFNEAVMNKDVVLIDVRTPSEFTEGHLENSINMDFNEMNTFSQQISELDKSTPVYLYCRSGGRSGRASVYMKEQGFLLIHDLDGGISSWNNSGYKTFNNGN